MTYPCGEWPISLDSALRLTPPIWRSLRCPLSKQQNLANQFLLVINERTSVPLSLTARKLLHLIHVSGDHTLEESNERRNQETGTTRTETGIVRVVRARFRKRCGRHVRQRRHEGQRRHATGILNGYTQSSFGFQFLARGLPTRHKRMDSTLKRWKTT
jgi:hypothetical protein